MTSKYRNVKTEIDGIVFDSLKESRRYQELMLLYKAKIITNLEIHKKYPLIVNGVSLGHFESDFSYIGQDGRSVIEDVKSEVTRRIPLYRLKAKLMIAIHGLRVVEIL